MMKRTSAFWSCTPPSPAGARKLARNAAFTLPELLTVIAIIAFLMMASFGALGRARRLGRIARSEAQLRQLVAAWQQYYTVEVLNSDNPPPWPPRNGIVEVDVSLIEPLIDPTKNTSGIVFYNYSRNPNPRKDKFLDPARDPVSAHGRDQQPYKISFGKSGEPSHDRAKTVFETTVALPRRRTVLLAP